MSDSIAQKIQLQPYQKPWSQRIIDILSKSNFYVDGSPTGTGKTVVTLHTAQVLNLKVFVVCPLSSIDNVWNPTAEKYGIEIIDAISFQSLR